MSEPAAIQPSMPLLDSLMDLARMDRTSWHMPGHAGGKAWPDWLKSTLSDLDVTELPLTDDLNRPSGAALAAMRLAAASFGAGMTRFITSGSTTALHILLTAVLGRHGRILMPRCVHQSVIHIAALLDLEICWLPVPAMPDDSLAFGLLPQPDAASVRSALQQNPGCRAVMLTSPDYYGTCADLAAISSVVHEHGAILLVDEAHGAYLGCAPDLLPAAALAAGADACVQSGHKTLPVLTPGSYLHIGRQAIACRRIDPADVERMIPVFQTSSPSFPIAATLDYARAWLEASGRVAVGQQLKYLNDFADSLPRSILCSPATRQPWLDLRYSRDPLRLVLTGEAGGDGWPAGVIARELSDRGLDIEFADLTRLVLIPSLQQDKLSWQQLSDVFLHMPETIDRHRNKKGHAPGRQLESAWRRWLSAQPDLEMRAGEALFDRHQRKQVPLAEAAGQINARTIAPYPPGIALIWPGERLDQSRVDFLSQLLENEISIAGIDQGNLWVVA